MGYLFGMERLHFASFGKRLRINSRSFDADCLIVSQIIDLLSLSRMPEEGIVCGP